jgi:outer membrane lipoprotein SlyB
MKRRSTGDLLVLMLAVTVCSAIIVGEVGILILKGIDSSIDTSVAGGTIGQIINTLVGLVAGYLAGRTETGRIRRTDRREEDTEA